MLNEFNTIVIIVAINEDISDEAAGQSCTEASLREYAVYYPKQTIMKSFCRGDQQYFDWMGL